MKIGKDGIKLIQKWEGFRSKPYICPSGHNTIGYGNTYYMDGKKVALTDKAISEAEASMLMKNILARDFVPKVDKMVVVEVGQNMFDAICALAYNVGVGAIGKSTLMKKLNSLDFEGAAAEFSKWNKAGGRVVAGLTARRAEERALFEKDIK